MKKTIFALIALLTLTTQARAMSYEQARNEALFLTDKMAYELNLSDAQYEAAYEINLDYLMGVTSRYDVYGPYWERRNADLQFILYSWQWEAFRAAAYFFRPLRWEAGLWHFGIYARYPHRDYFYFGRPHFYASYRGGHSWQMNGGHSYYERHSSHFRPETHHDRYTGMRDGWNRGDFHGTHSHSSTHVTERNGHDRGNHQQATGHDGHNSHASVTNRPSTHNSTEHNNSTVHNNSNGHGSTSGHNSTIGHNSIARNGNGSIARNSSAMGGGRSSSKPQAGGRK